ncbi:glycosyltransferase [Pseudobutyrivibrio xylanivorans]|uniref:Glycosyl transferases group 1 n=1 Tax=Pseudobutyrivibrio xylanivorans DSM 14809 TaxID=1123012 RepID=A0A1M6BGD6_PSEXY|nr:glycosyltransferase [Pseudobutyrivibrio xylanivorans]SHI47746.1 Glycosyl transferases group 1 [Pseudobutyrivibrio xylanivorans DSM 14809]
MNFLIFEMKTVCYNSYLYFGDSLGNALTSLGHSVEYFKVDENQLDDLEQYVGKHFDAMIDFNSDLPRALMDDDSYFLDHVDAPFFDFILDHPLYHHDSLKHKLKNFHVVCLDDNHKKYIEKYYPHIKSVTVTPMTGELAFGKEKIDWDEFNNRKYDILFSGTYTAPERLETAINKMPVPVAKTVYELIEMLKSDSDLTIEEAVDTLSETEIYDYINLDKPLHTQTFYLADAYVRCLNRKKLVEALDKCEHELHLFGALWEELPLKHATIHREIPFNLTFTVFTKAKISVNIMPNFKAGSHDRVFSSQLNGAVTLTDPTTLLRNEYKHGDNILFYDLKDIDESTFIVDENLKDLDKLKKIAQAGFEVASKNHTWTEIAKKLLSAL